MKIQTVLSCCVQDVNITAHAWWPRDWCLPDTCTPANLTAISTSKYHTTRWYCSRRTVSTVIKKYFLICSITLLNCDQLGKRRRNISVQWRGLVLGCWGNEIMANAFVWRYISRTKTRKRRTGRNWLWTHIFHMLGDSVELDSSTIQGTWVVELKIYHSYFLRNDCSPNVSSKTLVVRTRPVLH